MSHKQLTVLDIFCGAGGFSEGFRQQGFEIWYGLDSWAPAVDTLNHNYSLACKPFDLLECEHSLEMIEGLPDTDVIVGSPPCISFSNSNKSSNGDKSLGIRLMEIFLRVVAVKRFKRHSRLKAWFMENVGNASRYLAQNYTFDALNLSEWASAQGISSRSIAIAIEGNVFKINAADYGAPQQRNRIFVAVLSHGDRFNLPEPTHSKDGDARQKYVSLQCVKMILPNPYAGRSRKQVKDPNYADITIDRDLLTDHFYDSGIYEMHWRDSKFLKTTHPYMGRMSFPEDELKPSRTVVASPFPRSREALIYRSEHGKTGDGEFRSPTVREAATLMTFPITYQFMGSESNKWKLVGNAVCPVVSSMLARQLRCLLDVQCLKRLNLVKVPNLHGVPNLNDYRRKTFDNPPTRKPNARFRSQPFKDANMAVTLSNYDIDFGTDAARKWRATVTYGIGKGYGIQKIDGRSVRRIERTIVTNFCDGPDFVDQVKNHLIPRVASAGNLQRLYETHKSVNGHLHPVALIEEVRASITKFVRIEERIPNAESLFRRNKVPKKQLYALYAIVNIAAKANKTE